MTTKVVYYSKTKNTKKVAEAMASALGSVARSVESDNEAKQTDLLFLGCSIYKKDIDPSVKKYIASLDPQNVGKVVLFSTGFSEDAIFIAADLLKNRGISVSDKYFNCKDKFLLLNLKHPDKEDLDGAEKFAKGFIKG